MNREILFRAWDKENKRMISDVLHFIGGNKIVNNEVKNFIPMQYTGLKDKNGKEIFEGDWCRFTERGKIFETKQGLVEYYGTGFKAVLTDRDDAINLDRYYEIEIIGNVFENPKLLNN